LTPATHDSIFAAVSHLPHVLSFALVSELASRANASELFGFAAGGFRDFTRIAASSPEMWRDVALQNRTALLAELDNYCARWPFSATWSTAPTARACSASWPRRAPAARPWRPARGALASE
jgi:prephenate dehydrogenase